MVVPSHTVSKQWMTYQQDLASQFIQVGIQGPKQCNTRDKFRQLLDHWIAKYYNSSHATLILKHKSQQTNTLDHSNKNLF